MKTSDMLDPKEPLYKGVVLFEALEEAAQFGLQVEVLQEVWDLTHNHPDWDVWRVVHSALEEWDI